MNPSNFAPRDCALVLSVDRHSPLGLHGGHRRGRPDWIVPLVIVFMGMRPQTCYSPGGFPRSQRGLATFINACLLPRQVFGNRPVAGELVVLTGIPMVLFTFLHDYRPADLTVAPCAARFSTALASLRPTNVLIMLHVNFTMFYSVTAICFIRGLWLFTCGLRERARREGRHAHQPRLGS